MIETHFIQLPRFDSIKPISWTKILLHSLQNVTTSKRGGPLPCALMNQTIKSTNQLFTGFPSQWVTSHYRGAQWGSERRSSCHSSPGPPRSTQVVRLISPASSPLGLSIDCSYRPVGLRSDNFSISLSDTLTSTFFHPTLKINGTCGIENALWKQTEPVHCGQITET